jgi:hypothetical protein
MSWLLKATLIGIALLGAPIGYVFYQAHEGSSASNWRDGGYHGAPGPLVGAGLPVLLIAGGALYGLVRRSRRGPN